MMYEQNEVEISMGMIIAIYQTEVELNQMLDAGMASLIICVGLAMLIVGFV